MDEILKHKCELLRSQLPIGLNGAIKLLKETEGDIEQAKALFKDRIFVLVKEKSGMQDNVILNYLEKNNYDTQKTLECLFEEKYTLTERILIKNKDKEKALTTLQNAIEQTDNLSRRFWLDAEEMKKLNRQRYCFVIIQEWMNYEDWEGFEPAVCTSFCVPAATQIKEELGMQELAENILQAHNICEEFYTVEREITDRPDIRTYNDYFEGYRDELIDNLYSFVKRNIYQFP